jgi:cytochrome bd-type quinol oxidase subunit 2
MMGTLFSIVYCLLIFVHLLILPRNIYKELRSTYKPGHKFEKVACTIGGIIISFVFPLYYLAIFGIWIISILAETLIGDDHV